MYIYENDMCCEFVDEGQISVMPEKAKLAHAYVPYQHAKCIYSAKKGLQHGTIFPDLVMPYHSPFPRKEARL